MSLRDHCYNSLGEYYLALNPAYDYVPFQQERIVPVLEGVECGDIDRLMLFMPAGHSKTDLCTKAFVPWYLGRNPRNNVILLCHTQPLAKDFGSHVRNVMAKNEIQRAVFPDIRVNTTNHASDFFTLNKGGAFYAFGMDGGMTGRRADLILIDDPIKGLEDALSETVQNILYSTYKAVIKDRLRPHGKIVIVITRWATRDLPARILSDEGEDWKVLVLKAQEKEPDGPYLWESHFGKKPYEEAKRDKFIWDAKWQQTPEPRLMQGFSQDWLRFYTPQDMDKLAKWNAYIFVDPAMGKNAASDRSALLVVIAGPEQKIFLVDAVLDRLDPSERINELIRLCRIWKPLQIAYEEYALTADSHFLKLEMDRQGINDVVVTSVGRKGIKGLDGGKLSKHDRIMQLQPDFRDARIWLPKQMIRKQMDGSDIDIISYFINREYLPYAGEGSVEHDDVLDCLSRIHDGEVSIQFVESGKSEENYENYGSNGSWEVNW